MSLFVHYLSLFAHHLFLFTLYFAFPGPLGGDQPRGGCHCRRHCDKGLRVLSNVEAGSGNLSVFLSLSHYFPSFLYYPFPISLSFSSSSSLTPPHLSPLYFHVLRFCALFFSVWTITFLYSGNPHCMRRRIHNCYTTDDIYCFGCFHCFILSMALPSLSLFHSSFLLISRCLFLSVSLSFSLSLTSLLLSLPQLIVVLHACSTSFPSRNESRALSKGETWLVFWKTLIIVHLLLAYAIL